MDLYTEKDYKQIIRKRVKDLGRTKKAFTLQKLAEKISIQNSYLSKALNDEKTHLNEDHLYRVCKILEFLPQETDYLFLLRARAVTVDSERKSFLESKINRMKSAAQRNAHFQDFDTSLLNQEMAYLFDPLCALVHVSLFIDEYRENPKKLSLAMGISQVKLKQTLSKLQDLDFVELGEDGFTVAKVKQYQIHYGTDHPLMRTHQALMRNKSSAHLPQVPEEEKHCFMGTFSGDEDAFAKVRARFQAFLKEVEQIVGKAPSESVYQVNFDLFKWL